MRRVTLGYAFEGHQPDETIEVPDAVARRLLHDGRARRADDEVAAEQAAAEAAATAMPVPDEPPVVAPNFEYMTLAELRDFAALYELVIPADVRKRPAIAAHLRAAWTRAPEAPPAPGTEKNEEA